MLKGKKILIIGKVWPEPNSSAAGKRMMQLISFFQRMEMEITFVSTANESKFQEDLSKRGVSVKKVLLNDDSFDLFLEKLRPDFVVFDRFLTEEQFGWRIDEFLPSAIKVLNTEDLHFLRGAREEAVKKGIELDVTAIRSSLFQRELMSIYRCDLTLLVSTFEKELLVNHYSIDEDFLFYYPVFADKQSKIFPFEERKDFMFIGNYHHSPNWDAVQVLKKEIWPIIRKMLPDTNLNIYGAYPGQKVLDFHNEKEGFIVHGRVEDAIQVTANSRVSLVPLRFGAGIKGKLLEAMSVGTPTITTSIGAEAMMLDNEWCGFIEDDFHLFAKAAVELYQDKVKWKHSQSVGCHILKEKFSEDKFEDSLIKVMELIFDNRDENRKNNIVGSLLKHHTVQSSMYLSKWIMEKNK